MKEAYFERAAAYFELGEFDRAIKDFITSDVHSNFNTTQLCLGVTAGILHGVSDSIIDFIPSTLSTLQGLGNGLWAFSKDPIGASQEFVNAAIVCIEYIKSHSTTEILQDLVPELKELVQSYDHIDDFRKGKLIGHVIGKYGIDILLAKESVALIKAFRDLKKANQVMTLEALASPKTMQTILLESSKHWEMREVVLKNGNLKIHSGRQGKHLENHPNYKDLVKTGNNPSLFVHTDPERLLREYAGTGIKDAGNIPGMPGYKEIVDFKEFIGYVVKEHTCEKVATTHGKIHYAKDGVHIVPYYKGK
jgi:hypothetical protein